jgi:hypothetical protein
MGKFRFPLRVEVSSAMTSSIVASTNECMIEMNIIDKSR